LGGKTNSPLSDGFYEFSQGSSRGSPARKKLTETKNESVSTHEKKERGLVLLGQKLIRDMSTCFLCQQGRTRRREKKRPCLFRTGRKIGSSEKGSKERGLTPRHRKRKSAPREYFRPDRGGGGEQGGTFQSFKEVRGAIS